MRVKYVHQKPGVHTGNIIWLTAYPMVGGKFPYNHPCAPGKAYDYTAKMDGQFGISESLTKFRSKGYWASCFPEGDGITMKCDENVAPETVIADIKECFGWEVNYE